jgi:hypothetical protein
VTFHDQIHIVPRPPWPRADYEVSKGGDSGSVWVNEDNNKAIGLHFAGETDPSPTSEFALANRIDRVAELLSFSFTPLFRPPPVIDDRLREIIRRALCRHFPWLCGAWPTFHPGREKFQQGHSEAAPLANGETQPPPGTMPSVNIDSLIEEIMDEIHRSS